MPADLTVLTVPAAQSTTGKKNRPGTSTRNQRRLFSPVESSTGKPERVSLTAKTGITLSTVYTTPPGTESTGAV